MPLHPWLALVLVAVLGVTASAANAGFKVERADSRLRAGVHRVDARIAFDLSEAAIEAMENGVALTLSVEMEVLKDSRFWDRRVAGVTARHRIQLHALSGQYVAKNQSTGQSNTFRSFEEMARELGRIDDFPLLDDNVLEDEASYTVRIRAKLDIESLPSPLRALAYFSRQWRLSSGWTSWPLQR